MRKCESEWNKVMYVCRVSIVCDTVLLTVCLHKIMEQFIVLYGMKMKQQ